MTIWTGNSALQVLPDSRKGQRNIGGPGSRQDVGSPGPAGTAVFWTAYGLDDQLSATVRADALWAAPGNAGQPVGLVPVYIPPARCAPRRGASAFPRSAWEREKGGLSPYYAGETPALRRASPFMTLSQGENYEDNSLKATSKNPIGRTVQGYPAILKRMGFFKVS